MPAQGAEADYEVVIVGAGISGIAIGIELLRRGQDSFILLESERELGGTWRDNTYPGVAVDIPSVSYCFSFESDYPWSRVFAPGREIQAYVEHCAQKYGISPHIRYDAKVVKSVFDPATDAWSTQLAQGPVVTSRFLVAATGLLSQPKLPAIPGLQSFAGTSMHTARWDHDYPLSGKRVGVIGTGASAVQLVPEVAKQAAQLTVFQRTPIWVSPRFDGPLNHDSIWSLHRFAAVRALQRFLSEFSLEALTFFIVNYRRYPLLVRTVGRLIRGSMRRQLDDPELAAKLLPDYGLGCKRPTVSNSYLPAFKRDNVALVTTPIGSVCPAGVVTTDGVLHELDALILATGFLTTEQGNAPSFEVECGDVELGQFWEDNRLQAYAGVSVPGFPNFFLTAGPYAGGFNWFAMLQANLAHIMCCMEGAKKQGATRVEIGRSTHEAYMQHIWQRAEGTVFKDGTCVAARSYYLDRHGDAALPLPHTPWWRALRGRIRGTSGYRFTSAASRGASGSTGR